MHDKVVGSIDVTSENAPFWIKIIADIHKFMVELQDAIVVGRRGDDVRAAEGESGPPPQRMGITVALARLPLRAPRTRLPSWTPGPQCL